MNIIETAKEALRQQLRSGNTTHLKHGGCDYQITARDILSDAIEGMSVTDQMLLVFTLSSQNPNPAAQIIANAVNKTIIETANDNLIGWLAAERERTA